MKRILFLACFLSIAGCVSTRTYIQTVNQMTENVHKAQIEAIEYKTALKEININKLLRNPDGEKYPQFPVVMYSFKKDIAVRDTVYARRSKGRYSPFVYVEWPKAEVVE